MNFFEQLVFVKVRNGIFFKYYEVYFFLCKVIVYNYYYFF